MKTGFTIFRVKTGKEERANEWLELLVDRREDCIATLQREAMYYESIFQTNFQGRMFLAWFSVQGKLNNDVRDSEHEKDQLHISFFDECLEIDAWEPIDMEHVITFVPPQIEKVVCELDMQSQTQNAGKVQDLHQIE